MNTLWAIVEEQLGKTRFVAGNDISMADIMLSVHANWNNYFLGRIQLGENTLRMIADVSSRESFKKSLVAENIKFNVR